MRSGCVLVAEDNRLNFEVVREALIGRGHRVEWAPDGEAALALLESGRFDLLLLDLHMPRLDGLSVIRALRESPTKRELKVIVLTADASPGTREELIDAGVDGCLFKPLHLGVLAAEIEATVTTWSEDRRAAVARLSRTSRARASKVAAAASRT
jgi:CheY-like chemotaxis protein